MKGEVYTRYISIMIYYIYQIKNKVNEKKYIGKTVNPCKRWSRHSNYPFSKTNKKDECPKLYAAIRKYGINWFEFTILREYNSHKECCQAERDFIKLLDTIKNGYNISEGGEGVRAGIHHPFYGKKHTKESRNKISLSKKGKKMGPASKERKAKISAALKGKERTKTKGENNPASKLKADEITVIRKLVNEGKTITEVSKQFSVSRTLIKLIVDYKAWSHIP